MRRRRSPAWSLLALLLLLPACGSKPSRRHFRILCLGDSLTESRFGTYLPPLRRLLRQESAPVLLISAARPGFTSGEYLAFLKESRLLDWEKPDIALLMLGTNDVREDGDHTELPAFCANMSRILDLLGNSRSPGGSSPRVVIATIPPIFGTDGQYFSSESAARVNTEINPAIRRIARERKLALADMEPAFVGRSDLIPGVHPNAAGYGLIAAEFFQVLAPLLAAR